RRSSLATHCTSRRSATVRPRLMPIDARKLAILVRGAAFAEAYVYSKLMRATRELLRRRTYLVHERAELLARLRMTFLVQPRAAGPEALLCRQPRRPEPKRLCRSEHAVDARRRPGDRHRDGSADQATGSGTGF